MLAIAGGTASGKSILAKALALHRPGAVVLIHLDDFYVPAHEPHRGARAVSATGAETLDWNHPRSIDQDAAAAALQAAATRGQHRMTVVELLFALSLPKIADHATWRIYVHTPDDIRLARKLMRKIEVQHQDPLVSLRNYLLSGRERHAEYVAPTGPKGRVLGAGSRVDAGTCFAASWGPAPVGRRCPARLALPIGEVGDLGNEDMTIFVLGRGRPA
ncbi:uridine kinase [Streptomyces nigra]|uniref:uridine kinase family protein n=1 Tax=Streptomyces nigra TaxID=1827580 RepID=UPI0036378F11